jgi:lipoprotein-anchoring transpeptidase ErfK/SrfK
MQISSQSLHVLVEDSLRRGRPETAPLVIVDASRQRMDLWDTDRVVERHVVSTARAGLGERNGSGQTPRGYHEILERIGRGASPGQVFVAREPTSQVVAEDQWRISGGPDLVLSRILWLSGLEPGRNQGGDVDTHDRLIYLHGTNQEHLLGAPASAGCVRMANRAVIRLFDCLDDRMAWCWIGE